MKLPKGAFTLGNRSAFTARGEHDGRVGVTQFVADPFDHGTAAAGPYDLIDGWRAINGWVITRQQARKFVRRLLAGIKEAEGAQRTRKIVRRHG